MWLALNKREMREREIQLLLVIRHLKCLVLMVHL